MISILKNIAVEWALTEFAECCFAVVIFYAVDGGVLGNEEFNRSHQTNNETRGQPEKLRRQPPLAMDKASHNRIKNIAGSVLFEWL
jgi:hypothetical protein